MAKQLDKAGVQYLWGKIKAQDAKVIKENVTDKLGAASGIATLGADSKLTASQLPSLKTVNGESIVGSGNISIDLSIYTIVESLASVSTPNPNKIYLVLTSPATGQEQDVYTEYAYINGKWEKFGEYKAAVDLEPYLKTNELDDKNQGLTYLKKAQIEALGYQTASEVQAAIADAVTGGTLDLQDYVKFTDLATDKKAGALSSGGYNVIADLGTNGNVGALTEATGTEGEVLLKYSKVTQAGNGTVTRETQSVTFNAVSGTSAGVMTPTMLTKLNGIAEGATADEAITTDELDEICV